MFADSGRKMRVGIVAGEASGDLLGAGLLKELLALRPNLHFEGIAGPKMIAEGARSIYPMDRLSVMGISEVLGRYTELSKMRKELIAHFIEQKVDLFIGIDAPDFNLGIERQLHNAGIKTVHYVSPSVWAWRKYRVRKIARYTDLMLTLFPFEAAFYQQHGVPVEFVGHPLADIIPLENDKMGARSLLGLPSEKRIVALLPGSRSNELQYLGRSFLEVASCCIQKNPDLHFVIPLSNMERRKQFEKIVTEFSGTVPVTLIDGLSREVMAASDVVLLASGTAALEALLLKRPMVVAYRLAPLTYWIAKRMVKLKYYSLPNQLLSSPDVPEYIQDEIIPDTVANKLLSYLSNEDEYQSVIKEFEKVHLLLKKDASRQAAKAIVQLINRK
jgi:lipid-A-disaccharide synthase